VPERKPFNPDVRRLLDDQAQSPKPPNEAQAARDFLLHTLDNRASIPGLPNSVTANDLEIAPGLNVRLYHPPGDKQIKPVLVYVHGGGWVIGSVAVFDPFCRLLSNASGVIIASVEYRLAPEHPYPAALEDTLTALQWAAGHANEWGGDPLCIALGGDSAGGNLAAVAANQICQQDSHLLSALMLLYPVTDHPTADHPSYSENATGYGLDADRMRWFWQQYIVGVSANDPNVSPLQIKNVPPLPPTLITTAEYDVLRDEGVAYAQKLSAAGIQVTHLHSPDMSHNFPATPNLVARFPQCRQTLDEIAAWLQAILYKP
jgi:acetyl esterase